MSVFQVAMAVLPSTTMLRLEIKGSRGWKEANVWLMVMVVFSTCEPDFPMTFPRVIRNTLISTTRTPPISRMYSSEVWPREPVMVLIIGNRIISLSHKKECWRGGFEIIGSMAARFPAIKIQLGNIEKFVRV
jgi:hypothetical protein